MKNLKEQKAELIDQADVFVNLAKEEDRELTSEEVDSINVLMEQAKEFTGKIETENKKIETLNALDQAKADLNRPDAVRSVPGGDVAVLEGYHDNRADDPKGGFPTLGHMAEAVYQAAIPTNRGAVDERLKIGAAITGMGQSIGADGGFGVPPEHANKIWMGLQEEGDNLIPMTDNFTVTGDSLDFPAVAETSRADGSRWGGVESFWISEGSQATDSNATLRKVVLEPQQLVVKTTVTNKLLKNNTVALDQFITRAATSEINFKVGDAIINGTGAGQPLGIVGSGAEVTITRAGGTAVAAADVDSMWARLHPKARARSIWFHNVDVGPQLANIEDTEGRPLMRAMNSLSGAEVLSMKGRPLIPLEYCATLGTVGDLILADMKGYTTGTRGSIDASMSIHLRFDFLESVFLWVFEIDGKPWLEQPITPKNGTNTLSHFITLT